MLVVQQEPVKTETRQPLGNIRVPDTDKRPDNGLFPVQLLF